jgi:ribonuclease VapC
MTEAVMDASALIALVRREEGGEKVASVLGSAIVAAPNWAEVLRNVELKLGWGYEKTTQRLCSVGLGVEPVTQDDAERVARLDLAAANKDLSLADRFCLAVAERLELPAYTSDAGWVTAETKAKVVRIR